MLRQLHELVENLEEFTRQGEYSVLVLSSTDSEIPYVLKCLEKLDAEDASDLFFSFPWPFTDVSSYVTRSLAGLEAQVEVLNHRRRQEGGKLLPALSPEWTDVRRPPRERLLAALDFLRALLPNEEEHRVVLSLLPTEVRAPNEYAQWIASLLSSGGGHPWMKAVRLLVRDARQAPLLLPALRKQRVEGVLALEVDLSTAALTRALERDTADPAVPLPERMMGLLQLAMLDYAYKRYPEALRKYGVLYTYHEQRQAPGMQALCLLGVGDVLRALGKGSQALERYQQGLALAMRAQALPVLLNLLLAAAEASSVLGRHADAQSYFESAAQVAGGLLNPCTKADALEKAGTAALAQGKHGVALTHWKECEALSLKFEYWERLETVLSRQMGLFKEARMEGEQAAAKARLQEACAGRMQAQEGAR
jgi:tetratricopeptide (TPR) repeat protein